MAKNLIDFLKGLATKAGVKIDTPEIEAFLKTENLDKIEVPDTFVNPVGSSLISMAEAKNNHTEIQNHYKSQIFDGLDAQLKDLMTELELDVDSINAVNAERSSFKKPGVLAKQIKALEQKKATASAPDKKALSDQIDQLNAQLRSEKERVTGIEKDFAGKEKQMKIKYVWDNLLSAYKTTLDTLDPSAKATTLSTLINQRLQDKNAKVDFDGNGSFVLLKNDGTNFFSADNVQMNPKQFVEQLLADTKLLVTTPAASSTPQNNNAGNGASSAPDKGNGGNNNNRDNKGAPSAFKGIMAKSIGDYQKATENGAFETKFPNK